MVATIDPKLRFLIVDDKPFVREMLHGMLLRAKVRDISQAASGEHAQIVMEAKAIDFILCDWNMRPGNGLELLQAVRCGKVRGCKPDVHFVMVTSASDAEVVNLAIVLDANGYLVKPVSFEALTTSIAKATARSWQLKSPKYYQAIETLPTPRGD